MVLKQRTILQIRTNDYTCYIVSTRQSSYSTNNYRHVRTSELISSAAINSLSTPRITKQRAYFLLMGVIMLNLELVTRKMIQYIYNHYPLITFDHILRGLWLVKCGIYAQALDNAMQNKICSLDGVDIEFLAGPYNWSPCTLLVTASVLPQKRLYISIVLILPLQMAVTMPGCVVKFKQDRLKL